MSIGPHLLGRTLEHDPLSRNFVHPVRRAVRKKNVTHTLAAPHLNQDDIGSCEGDTAAEFFNCAKAIRNRQAFWRGRGLPPTKGFNTRQYLKQINALDLYSLATTKDNDGIPGEYPPEDTGTSGVGIAKAMQERGGIERYNWTFTFNDFLAALQTQPIMLGTNWYDSMFEYDSNGFVIEPNFKAEPVGGHAFLAFAQRWNYKDHPLAIGCTNHWVWDDNSPWGVRISSHDGCFWIAGDWSEQLLIHEQGDSLVPVLF